MDGFAALFALQALALVAIIVLLVRLSARATPNATPTEAASFVAEQDDIEPSEERALRHHHRPGPKDDDGIRHCRCGDRYLDGVRT